MKSVAVIALACLLASASAFTPPMATRAVGNPFKKAPKKEAAPAKSSKKGPPASKGYPMFRADKIKFGKISGGGNKGPGKPYQTPNFADPRLQIERDPEFYAAAAKTRVSAFTGNKEYIYEDGLTDLERTQRKTIPGFLTGSAKSQADLSTIRDDIESDNLIFGLSPDRFQLLFITIFGLFTLVGCLSGNLNL